MAVAKVEGTCANGRQEDEKLDDASVSHRLIYLDKPRADETFRTDMALIKDKSFKTYAKKYAESEEEFFKE